MKHRLVISAFTASMLVSTVSAGTMGPPVMPPKDWAWVGTVGAGPTWARGGATQTFYLVPEIEKTYAARKSSNALATGELFAGIQKALSPEWRAQLGLAVATTGNARLQGEVWDDADPQFNNYSYQYKVRNTRLQGKIILCSLYDQR